MKIFNFRKKISVLLDESKQHFSNPFNKTEIILSF